jgi:hypothetical protein
MGQESEPEEWVRSFSFESAARHSVTGDCRGGPSGVGQRATAASSNPQRKPVDSSWASFLPGLASHIKVSKWGPPNATLLASRFPAAYRRSN